MPLVLDKLKELQSEGGRPEPSANLKKYVDKKTYRILSRIHIQNKIRSIIELGAQINSWHVFHCKSNTFALVTCFLPSVLGETGVGAVSMSLLVGTMSKYLFVFGPT